ncbi:hypothetical protein PILCRDRAFT_739853 [Piloderma croceum F 1598]|uniref:Uncharacterized protein n=1 Tax=Piloderma croceum (strain F 1598) TaxID=765440 RepID=A0A0C3EIT1_PILCF|nr:hypothetical protein PILCRDRAFT_739853 [Piloderma croceum F 1598]
MSRTNSGQQPQPQALGQQRPAFSAHNSASGGLGMSRHHHSRSVPAPSLLGDLKSIWASTDPPFPSPSHLPQNQNPNPIGSFKSTTSTNFGGRSSLTTSGGGEGLSQSYTDRDSSLSMLSPTNASAAFLGGLHHHFLNRSGGNGVGGVQRSVSGERGGGLQAHSNFSTAGGMNGAGSMGMGMAFSPPRLNAFGSRPPFSTHDSSQPLSHDLHLNGTSTSSQSQSQAYQTQTYTRQPPSSDIAYHNLTSHQPSQPSHTTTATTNSNNSNNTSHNPHLNPQTALSPSTRALQSHAPGQSLPQGLAAGYSRIHALPPPPNMGSSPSFSGGVGSAVGGGGVGGGSPGSGGGLEWAKVSSDSGNGGSGLESMFSRLSYSAATSRPTPTSSALSMTSGGAASNTPPPALPPSTISRNPSGSGKPWQSGSSSSGGGAGGGGGPLSPLSGPVLTGDDDDLFSMDG